MSYASAKGYRAERDVKTLLSRYHPECFRPRAGAQADVGDFGNVPVVISVKDWEKLNLGGWCDDLIEMVHRSGKPSGAVWHKRRRFADPLDWFVTMPGRLYLPYHLALCGVTS